MCYMFVFPPLQVVELLSNEDVDLTVEQIREIVDLMAKERRMQNADEQSVKDAQGSESAN